jgi:hypothetical protein
MSCYNSGVQKINMNQLNKVTGNFGQNPSNADIQSSSNNYPMELALEQMHHKHA